MITSSCVNTADDDVVEANISTTPTSNIATFVIIGFVVNNLALIFTIKFKSTFNPIILSLMLLASSSSLCLLVVTLVTIGGDISISVIFCISTE